MARRRGPPLQQVSGGRKLDLLDLYCCLSRHRSGGRFTSTPSTYAIRKLISSSPPLWRLLEPEEILANPSFDFLTTRTLRERIAQMAISPFPSSPQRPPTHVVTIRSPRGLLITNFCAEYAAKAWIDLVAPRVKWLDDDTICPINDESITIQCNHIETVMEATTDFELPDPYPKLARSVWADMPTADEPKISSSRDQVDTKNYTVKTSLQELSVAIGVSPAKLRSKLRKLNHPKPYVWQSLEIAKKVLGIE